MAGWGKQVQDMATAAKAQGWRTENVGDGVKFWPTDKAHMPIVVHLTLSDYRSQLNYTARLRRAGLIWPPKKGNR